LEEQILQQTRGLERRLLEEAAQKKAGQTPPDCPVCGNIRRTRDHERTFHTRFGLVRIKRLISKCNAPVSVPINKLKRGSPPPPRPRPKRRCHPARW
jgi:hypothetical protein